MCLLPRCYRCGNLGIRRRRPLCAGGTCRAGRPSCWRVLRHIHRHHRVNLRVRWRQPGDRMRGQIRLHRGLYLRVRRPRTLRAGRALGAGWPRLGDDLRRWRLRRGDAVLLQLLLRVAEVRGQRRLLYRQRPYLRRQVIGRGVEVLHPKPHRYRRSYQSQPEHQRRPA